MIPRTRIKICGLTRPEEVEWVARGGADALGLVFHPASPRHVSIEQARSLLHRIPPFLTAVGLFVDAPAALIEAVLQQVPLQLLQFHGAETPAQCDQWQMPYIKVVRMRPGTDLVQYATDYPRAQALLVDAWVEGVPGGTGTVFDWHQLPQQLPLPLILSGGLNPENVAQAMRLAHPWAVDVSSGVERQPGCKDPQKIARFIQGVRNEDLRHA